MNIKLQKEISKIKNYLKLMFVFFILIQIFGIESILITFLGILSKFFNININHFFILSAISIITILFINIYKYIKKTKNKYFIYKYLERNFPSLSSSLSTIADVSLKTSASSDFINETEKLAIQEIKKIKLKNIPPIFNFSKLKYLVFTTSFLWILLLFPLKSDAKALFFGKPIKKTSDIIEITNIYNLKAEVIPPEYLLKEKQIIENFDGSLKVYTGSEVILTGVTKENYNKCIFVYGDREHPCNIKDNKFNVKHKILMNSLYYIKFFNNTKINYKSQNFEAEIIPDSAPTIRIAFPEENMTLNYNDILEITAEASDDIAIKMIKFKYQIDDSEFETINIEDLGSKTETINYKLKLSEFEKGDTITYYFEAYDNDTILGPKIATTRRLKVEIISEMKLHESFLDTLNKIAKELVLKLADHLELDRNLPTRKLIIEKRNLNEKITKINNKLKTLLKSEDPLLSVSSKTILKSVIENLEKEILNDDISRYSKDLIQVLENSIIYITDISDREKIEIISQLYKSLKTSKTKLKDLINNYKNNPNKETKKKILKEIRNIKRKIKRIMEKLSELSSDIDSKFINKEASKVKKMAENMEKMEDLLEKGELDKLLNQLEDLEKELNDMIEGVEDKKEGLMEERDQESDKQTQQFMNNLQDLIFEQEQLLKESEKITNKLQKDIQKQTKNDSFTKKNVQLLEEANNILFNLNKDLISNGDKENINRVSEASNLSISFLKEKNIIMSLTSLYEIKNESERIKDSYQGLIEWMMTSRNYNKIKEDYKLYLKAKKNKDLVIKNIEEILNNTQKSITPEDQKKMSQLSKSQENLKQKIKQLQNQAQKLPMTPPNAQEKLQKGENDMQNAKKQLENNSPNMAKFKQNSALNELKSLKKGMQQQQQQANKNQMSSSKSKGKKIKIPDENYKGPKELREDILKAMKKESPDGQKKVVEEYFKNIIKR
jgi:hypothetical protein